MYSLPKQILDFGSQFWSHLGAILYFSATNQPENHGQLPLYSSVQEMFSNKNPLS
jgi:hypothetical protein